MPGLQHHYYMSSTVRTSVDAAFQVIYDFILNDLLLENLNVEYDMIIRILYLFLFLIIKKIYFHILLMEIDP